MVVAVVVSKSWKAGQPQRKYIDMMTGLRVDALCHHSGVTAADTDLCRRQPPRTQAANPVRIIVIVVSMPDGRSARWTGTEIPDFTMRAMQRNRNDFGLTEICMRGEKHVIPPQQQRRPRPRLRPTSPLRAPPRSLDGVIHSAS